ncbi:HipA protein [Legionella birminghamensis]|uniref:HipA protein n=1 Tax=Legionella birminghamensis TaxID=28083 RepID=A0A378ICS4_9GAMM|nr:HipA N-terminal domain-containing protein [Legionella birminghamensis]KTC74501.1 HipA protein [Legionella birminghamensis]STX32630.1 HipA protein [Legionella birminghamensis]
MRKARVLVNNIEAGILEESETGKYLFNYHAGYEGAPVSLTMPLANKRYEFDKFPPFFEGLLPEGIMLEALLRKYKIDRNDYFGQLIKVGQDVVGAVVIEEFK